MLKKKEYLHPRIRKPSIAEIRIRISEHYQSAMKEAKDKWDYPCYYPSGVDLLIIDDKGNRHLGLHDKMHNLYKPTFDRLYSDAQNLANQHTKPMIILIQGSIDGADSPNDYHEGNYQPKCGEWSYELATIKPIP